MYCPQCKKNVNGVYGVVTMRNVVEGKDEKFHRYMARDVHCEYCFLFICSEKMNETNIGLEELKKYRGLSDNPRGISA